MKIRGPVKTFVIGIERIQGNRHSNDKSDVGTIKKTGLQKISVDNAAFPAK